MSDSAVFSKGGALEPQGSLVAALADLGDRARLCEQFDPEGAVLYDDCYGIDPQEISILRSVLRDIPGPLLELAAGNGRLTIPLLQLGRDVVALDISEGMLDRLRERVSSLRETMRSRLQVHLGDMTRIELPPHMPQRFGAVVLMLASISLLERDERIATLASARAHLSAGGRVILSVVIYRRPREEGMDRSHDETGRSGQVYRLHEHRAPGSSRRQVAIFPVVDDDTATVPVSIGVHHVLDLDSVLAEIAAAGLVVTEQRTVESPDEGLAEVFLVLASQDDEAAAV